MMNRTELREYVKDNPDEPVDETVSKFGVSKAACVQRSA
jgi:hypothetical protein